MIKNKKDLKKINILIKKKNIFKRYIFSIAALFVLAAAYNLFILPNNLVYGGVSGIAIITKDIIDPAILILVANVILLIFSYFILGKEKTSGSLVGIFLYPLFIKLTANIGEIIILENNDILLNVLFAGFLSGVSTGIIIKNGFSTGGTDIAAQILSKLSKTSIGKSLLIIDGVIIALGGIRFGLIKVMYAIILLYIYSLMTDKIIIGISDNKAFYVITSKEEEVKLFVLENLNHGVTILKAKGGYKGERKNILLCVVPARQYFKLKEGIALIDRDAFFVVTDAYEVKGGA
ncbi:MAG TPA: YitT family protein [Mollicutes bacterium]|nr:YitT family protein [Mollicutes bacterium]